MSHNQQHIFKQTHSMVQAYSLPWMREPPKTGFTSVSQIWRRAAEYLTCCSNFMHFHVLLLELNILHSTQLHCSLVCSTLYFRFILPMHFDFPKFILSQHNIFFLPGCLPNAVCGNCLLNFNLRNLLFVS